MDLGSEEDLHNSILTWESKINKYETLTGNKLDSELKAAVMVRHVPPGVRQHLQLNVAVFAEDYLKLRDMFLAYLKVRTTASPSMGPRPIEIDEYDIKSEGRGKRRGCGGPGAGKDSGEDCGKSKSKTKDERFAGTYEKG